MIDLKILFENNDLIAVDKPEGVASITENDTSLDSIHSLLEKKLSQKIFIVHRLDKEVSGVILFAKNSRTHKFLNRQFNNRTVKKSYSALVHGIMKNDDGIINKPIREFGSGRMGIDEEKGKTSVTAYKVLKHFDNYTLIELKPTTGRRHQLRVHLYYIGYPIVGDTRYGDKELQSKFPRVMLHAKKIVFESSPGKHTTVESEIPESFNATIKNIDNK
ncbi:MAG: RluA family pseudouridine synthase [Elusimicrobiota bacterium]